MTISITSAKSTNTFDASVKRAGAIAETDRESGDTIWVAISVELAYAAEPTAARNIA